MKTMRLFARKKLPFTVLVFTSLLLSCINETEVLGDIDTATEVTFTIKVPASPAVATRAVAQGSEADRAITTIDLLLFDQQSQLYVGKVLSNNIVDINATEKTCTATLPKGRYDLVILANARSIVNEAIIPGNSPLEKTKGEIHHLLVKTLNPLTGIWNAQPGSLGYEHFPMWGEKLDFSIPASGTSLSVELVRMLAKVNVTFQSKEVSDKLIVESIMVCNFNKSGYLASNKWDFATADGVAQAQQNIDEKLSRAWGVDNGAIYANTAENPTIITTKEGIQTCTDEIFLFESQKPADPTSEQQRIEATCLILKGKYNGASEDSYYRIDFAKREGATVTYLNLLRNHIYSIVINKVNTAGHPSAEIAYQSFAADLNIGISSWSDGGVGETAFDGQYTLSITPNELELFKDLSTKNSIIIHTDYPVAPIITGINYMDVDNTNWLTTISAVVRTPLLDKENGKKKAYEVTFDCLENEASDARLAKINVTAGNRLNLQVNVAQTATPLLALHIYDITNNLQEDISELIFPSGLCTSDPIVAKSIRISWAPFVNNNECRSISTAVDTDFDCGTGIEPPAGNTALINETGIVEYCGIQPPSFTKEEVASPHEFLEKTRLYNYTTSNGVKSISKALILHQVHYNAVADVASYYLMNDKEYSFKVRSNSGWRVTLGGKDGSDGDPKGVVSKFTPVQGGYNTKVGQAVRFTLKDYIGMESTIGQADVKFTITCTDPVRKFDPIEVSLNTLAGKVQELSNSFMVLPGSMPIFIPVRRANGLLLESSTAADANWWLGTQITSTGENAKYGVKILWSDSLGSNGKALASDGVIKEVRAIGTGDTGYLFVVPGSKPGNAVVAITRTPGIDGGEGTGDILWSFHIWVTDYHPYNTNGDAQGSDTGAPQKYWMDRNLGAKTNIIGTANAYGLFYQYGRKDPFMGAATLTGTGYGAGKPRYNAEGDLIPYSIIVGATAAETVRNPMTLSSWWYGTSKDGKASTSSDSWNLNSKKTLYDPCPKGYRVPAYVNKASTIDSHDWGNEALSINGDGESTPLWTKYGIKWNDKGGFYPAAGYLAPDGTYSEVGTVGWARSANAHTSLNTNSPSLRFTNSNMSPNYLSIKDSAGAVRCVAE